MTHKFCSNFMPVVVILYLTFITGCDGGCDNFGPSYLMVFSAERAQTTTISENKLILTFSQPDELVTYFTDRPNRDAGIISLNNFITQIWPDFLVDDPPNAAVEYEDGNGTRVTTVFTLSNPILNIEQDTLQFDAVYIEGPVVAEMISPSIFVDDVPTITYDTIDDYVVPEVETAIPVFIGYTQKAERNDRTYWNQAVQINSLAEYEQVFGKDNQELFSIQATSSAQEADFGLQTSPPQYYFLQPVNASRYLLYKSIQLFYANGGGRCYVTAVAPYDEDGLVDEETLLAGLTAVDILTDSTLLLIPDALSLPTYAEYAAIVNAMLTQAYKLQDRMVLLYIYDGYDFNVDGVDTIEQFRSNVSVIGRKYGAAYFPWVYSSIMALDDVDFNQISPSGTSLIQLLQTAAHNRYTGDKLNSVLELIEQMATTSSPSDLNAQLINELPILGTIEQKVVDKLNLLPVAGAIAGVYATVDALSGVWTPPADIALRAMTEGPSVQIGDNTQADLNVDTISGLSINAIRNFTNEGTLVWGARTLDGNNPDWRYIDVRRTMIYLESSIKQGLYQWFSDANNETTWTGVKQMLEKFLTDFWEQGGLQGVNADDAFSVEVGLGTTMTADDILNGIMLVTVKVAVSHPAEFIVLAFAQEMVPTAE